MKKKNLLVLPLAGVLAMTGCSCNNSSSKVAKTVEEAKDYTVDQLVELAKQETGGFTVYSTSSKTGKAVTAFCEKYELTNCDDFTSVKQSEKDFYNVIDNLISGNSKEIDAVVTQNGVSVSTELAYGNLINYNPVVDGATTSDMYAFMYYVKEFAIKKDSGVEISNVWDLVEFAENSENTLNFKKSGEPINTIFLAQLTTNEWATKLQVAYDAKYGPGKCAEKLATDAKYVNAGYLFIDQFLSNVVNVSGESGVPAAVAGADVKTIGFSPVSKYSLGAEGNYDQVDFLNSMDGFNGFAYKFYTQISKTTDRPYTAMLFINYLSTEEGVAHYQEGNGVYSSNTTVTANLSELLSGYVIEDYNSVKSTWTTVSKYIEAYA